MENTYTVHQARELINEALGKTLAIRTIYYYFKKAGVVSDGGEYSFVDIENAIKLAESINNKQKRTLKYRKDRQRYQQALSSIKGRHEQLITELLSIQSHEQFPSIQLIYRAFLPRKSCVYFVYDETNVVYVGQTVNLKERWEGHHLISSLEDKKHRIGWIEIDESLLLFVETYLIGFWNPKFNVLKPVAASN